MSYFKSFGLDREPFSTSPDPEFFYLSKEHKAALLQLQITVRLKRGLSLLLADVGMGKTTLSRKLIQILGQDPSVQTAMIFTPVYENEQEFLEDLLERFHVPAPAPAGRRASVLELMKTMERHLLETGHEQNRLVVLLIDEAQKLSEPCLEILRSLLNFETNDHKILQLILVGQMELLPRISRMRNLWDRIAMKRMIHPLDVSETDELIRFRLAKAGYLKQKPIFDEDAVRAVHWHTGGSPRRIAMLCHLALQQLVMRQSALVDRSLVEDLIAAEIKSDATIAA